MLVESVSNEVLCAPSSHHDHPTSSTKRDRLSSLRRGAELQWIVDTQRFYKYF